MIKVQWNGLKQVTQAFKNLRRKIFPSALEQVHQTARDVREAMQQPGETITYPVQWDSTKQRRAFFATDGFGRGIPTRRSGAYQKGYKVIERDDGADVGNILSHATYIGGPRQSRIHRNRWILFIQTAQGILNKLPQSLKRRLTVVFRDEGFKVSE